MPGTEERSEELWREQDAVVRAFRAVREDLVCRVAPLLSSERAREYLTHGVCRRLSLMARALENIFRMCSPDRTGSLSSDDRTDVEINLHAFVINVHGVLDNIAWVVVFHYDDKNVTQRRAVSLFKEKVQQHLSDRAREYLNAERIRLWYKEYAQAYRDALAHRIPLYVPPAYFDPASSEEWNLLQAEINEALLGRNIEHAVELERRQRALGEFLPVFVHSYSPLEMAPPVYFHPQLIVDSKTVLEILGLVVPGVGPS